ncbi:VIT family protein [Nocardia cyriacigeorgica]|uniref:VIT1/CCC1 transporter family protein n=1 Tax=Nocardia cyriacigeorgica TaxID=135487 RepID=UPI000CE9E8CC|nr:VIT family protein [Nocardia cyriacigeorgica]MBF6089104.1 VIT family protein [Nocardia cyriacigeorgica]MBF6095840.1 VIT family protein [Nocardia cyriacigeorgica]MBF6397964.1 VIT family protein [Nocardia cyriacigeorgica]MBF6404522.1 VIT family protein [Nocardia cyriacigeorgica]MBF6499461.1 VIT family protein [Nocardia cyriacigeorgica]
MDASSEIDGAAQHPGEPHTEALATRLNWLRAGVLGANDGIVSTAGLVVGVAAANTATSTIFTAGIAGLSAGAISMAVGEYVSVSTQRDSEKALLAKERRELREEPESELAELTAIYRAKGLSPETARRVAEELTAHDAFTAHAEAELGLNPDELTNPWHAAFSSAVAFTVGALLPLLAILLPPTHLRIPVTFAAVLIALALTGSISARLGGSRRGRAVVRVVAGGALAMAITYGIGQLADVSGI